MAPIIPTAVTVPEAQFTNPSSARLQQAGPPGPHRCGHNGAIVSWWSGPCFQAAATCGTGSCPYLSIEGHKDFRPAKRSGGKPSSWNYLDRFDIDYSLCMYCGICVEVCPFDALHWTPEFEYSDITLDGLLHDMERLGKWEATVPPPQEYEKGAEIKGKKK